MLANISDIATKVFGDHLLNDFTASLRASSMDYSMNLPEQVYITFTSTSAGLSMVSATCDATIVKLIVEGAGLDYGPRRLLRGIANLYMAKKYKQMVYTCFACSIQKKTIYDKPATIALRHCQTIPNWQKNIRTQQDSQRTPSLRIEL